VTAKTCKGEQAVKSSILQYAMSDEIPSYIDEESRSLEQPLSGPAGDDSQLPPNPEVAARSPKAMVIGLGVAAAVLAAFAGYELLQAKESERLLDEAYAEVTTAETSRKNLESDFKKALAKKDMEIEEARADSQRLAENLAKEEEKNRILQAHADKAAAAVQANRELAKGMAKVEDEVRRLSGEVASRKTSSSVSKTTKKPLSAVERSVVQITIGPNKGRWYFDAADGFRSPLYGSRELALQDAKLHARTGH
jgi:F0F1-type ATP synthase membrane subunit b/b'